MCLILFLLQLNLIFHPGTVSGLKPIKAGQLGKRTHVPNERKYYSFRNNASLVSVLNILDPELSDSDSDSVGGYKSQTHATTYTKITTKSNIVNPLLTKSVLPNRTYKYGTTRHLKEIFLGRCFEYQYRKGIVEENEWDCNSLWSLFHASFAYKGPCNVTSNDYQPFLDQIDENVEPDRGLLWSGTRELAHKYSDFLFTGKYTTLEDTLAGYLLNGLTWCGHPKYGINFKECPWSCSLQSPYWSLANARFAQKLRGLVHIILNGTRMHLDDGRQYPTYMKNRYYLGPNVIPVLNKKNVKRIIIVVAHTLGMKPLEKCGMKSVKDLLDEIKKKGIPVECYNDPSSSRHMQCASDPNAKECEQVGVKHFIPADIGRLLPILSGKKEIAGLV